MKQLDIKNHYDCLSDNYVLVLTSNTNEKKAVNEQIQYRQSLGLRYDTNGSYIGIINDNFVIHICGTSGVSDCASISRIAMTLLGRDWFPPPKLLLLVGICWGVPRLTEVGDGIICNSVYSLNSSVVWPDKTEYVTRQFSSKLCVDKELVSQLGDDKCNFTLGELASLETRLSSDDMREQILKCVPGVIGGEMEAFGLMPSLDEVKWLIFKAVSDFGGDDFNRDSQVDVVKALMLYLPSVLLAVVEANDLSFSMDKESSKLLRDVLIGDTISISSSDINSDSLNDYLNNKLGPIFIYKLGRYSSGLEFDAEFPFLLCDLLLEVIQNSFRHGGSKAVSISFNQKSITVVESLKAFDLSEIKGLKGGATAWENVKSRYLNSDQMSYKVTDKRHRFDLKKIDNSLRDTIKNCSASIAPNSVRSGYSSCTLVVNDSCSAIYVDAAEILMTSRAIEVINDINDFLDTGKIVYIACRNQEQVLKYQEAIKSNGQNARIFVQ